nr:MAG TPA: RNA-dependent RNA polymerase [Caudoviricetes sp.]
MALDKQIYCYGVDTSYFYDEEEKYWHLRLLRLYSLRAKLKPKQKNNKEDVSWKLKSCNRVLKKNKERLSEILNSKRDTDLIRELNPSLVRDKNVVNLFESDLTRSLGIQTFTLTTEIFVIDVYFFQVFKNLVKNGFTYLGEKYVFLTASAGQIRQKKAVAIKESSFKRIEQKLMCGLTIDEINERGGMNQNKFLAYLALMNSATDVWQDFDIDKSIIVDDWETAVPGLVDHIDGVSYEIRREMTETVIPHMDGCGIMLDETTRMVRMPWVKGLLVTFPFDKFIKEKCGGEATVTDIYGNEHKIIGEDIRYIFTKSQFKLWKFYDSWDCYKARFKNFGCNACYCNIEEPYISKSRINYQMLQTLSDMTDNEIDRIISKTAQEIDDVGKDYQVTMRLLGATENNRYKSAMQEALLIYPELFKDSYNREILKQTKKSLVKQAKGGRLRVNGKYLFLAPDLYAFCEWLFLGEQNPQGLLADEDVYTNQYRDEETLACLRSPHLYREWAIRTNRRSLELDYWFGGTKCIYTSCHDLISRYLMFD